MGGDRRGVGGTEETPQRRHLRGRRRRRKDLASGRILVSSWTRASPFDPFSHSGLMLVTRLLCGWNGHGVCTWGESPSCGGLAPPCHPPGPCFIPSAGLTRGLPALPSPPPLLAGMAARGVGQGLWGALSRVESWSLPPRLWRKLLVRFLAVSFVFFSISCHLRIFLLGSEGRRELVHD